MTVLTKAENKTVAAVVEVSSEGSFFRQFAFVFCFFNSLFFADRVSLFCFLFAPWYPRARPLRAQLEQLVDTTMASRLGL